ncbi:MAG: substrate-binding periplasmic protein [Halodesulfovibrio sp.]
MATTQYGEAGECHATLCHEREDAMRWIIAMTLALGMCATAHAGSIRFSYDAWCPYSCLNDDHTAIAADYPGYYAEVLRAIYEPLGYGVEFIIRPWERALEETADGRLDAALSPARSEAPNLIFPDESIAELGWCFYTRSDSAWQYNGPASLQEQTLGVLRGNNFGDAITDYIAANTKDAAKVQEVTGLDFIDKNIRKLQGKRISVMLDEPATTDFFIMQNNLARDIVKAGCLPSQSMYPAFSPANPMSATYAKEYTEGIRRLRKSGQLRTILSRYGLTDWKNQPASE